MLIFLFFPPRDGKGEEVEEGGKDGDWEEVHWERRGYALGCGKGRG